MEGRRRRCDRAGSAGRSRPPVRSRPRSLDRADARAAQPGEPPDQPGSRGGAASGVTRISGDCAARRLVDAWLARTGASGSMGADGVPRYDARAHGARPADPRHAECRTGPASAAAHGTERRSPRRRSRNAVAGRLRNGGAGRDGAAHPACLRGRSGNRVPPAGGAGREEGRWRCGGRRGGGALRGPALYRLARLRAAGHAVEQHRRGAVRLRGVAAAASHGSPVEARRRATCGWEQPPDHGRRPRGGHRHLRRHRARHGRGADRRPPRQCRALARDVGILPALRRAGRADF